MPASRHDATVGLLELKDIGSPRRSDAEILFVMVLHTKWAHPLFFRSYRIDKLTIVKAIRYIWIQPDCRRHLILCFFMHAHIF